MNMELLLLSGSIEDCGRVFWADRVIRKLRRSLSWIF